MCVWTKSMITTCATTNYVPELELLLVSIKCSNPDIKVIVHCIDWPCELKEKFMAYFSGYDFLDVNLSKENRAIIQKDVEQGTKSGQILRLKPQLLHVTQLQAKQSILWVDADSIVLKPIAPLFDKINNVAFGCIYRPYYEVLNKIHVVFAVGVLGFANTELGNQALSMYAERAQLCKSYRHCYQDQISLFEVLKILNCPVYPMNELEHSLVGNVEAIIVSRREKDVLLGKMENHILQHFNVNLPVLYTDKHKGQCMTKLWDFKKRAQARACKGCINV